MAERIVKKKERVERLLKAANNTFGSDRGTDNKTLREVWIDDLTDEDKTIPPMAYREPQLVVTNDRNGCILTDYDRAAAFDAFDQAVKITRVDATDYDVRVDNVKRHFRKNPLDGSWYLYDSNIMYTRNRTLDIPHFDDALRIASSKLAAKFSPILTNSEIVAGDIKFSFEWYPNSNKYVLVNSQIIALPEIELTQAEYDDIINVQHKHKLQIFWECQGLTLYAPPRQPVQILNPVVITTTKDYNMAKYRLRKADELLIDVLEGGATNVALLLGKPGTGKTFFTDCFAKRIGAEYMYALCHDGTNAEDLFYSVNVGKAVLREGTSSEDIYQAGLLLRAVRASKKHKVVLCIDEIDKASKRTENLFLDFLQSYRVPFLGTQEVGVKENIVIFFTSNGYRPHSEAFLRRCYRHHFDFLPRDVEISLIGGTYAEKIVDALAAIRKDGASSPSIKEGMLFAHNLQYAKTKADIELLFYAHLCKEEEDFEVLKKGNFADKFVKPQYAKVKF